jgi:hypothetical protein
MVPKEGGATRPSLTGKDVLMLKVEEANTSPARLPLAVKAPSAQRVPAMCSVAASSYDRKWRFLHA